MNSVSRRAVIGGVALGGLSVATSSLAHIAESATTDLAFVHPELRPFAAMAMKHMNAMPDPTLATLPSLRKAIANMSPPPLPVPDVQKRSVKGTGNGPEVIIYVINAQPDKHKPAVIHTHGGGFVMGDAAGSVGALQPIAQALDCVIVTVEYRLAPEATFAQSIEDNYAALKWVYDNASLLGVDRDRIAVMGESAGGGHAALLAITARDRGEVPIVFQALIYPMLDDRTGTVTTPAEPIGTIVWTAAKNRFGWRSFLGQAPGTRTVPRAAVPARQTSLKGLAPAFIGVGSIDLFVDEDMEYARRLIDDGVPVELMVVPGAFHGFDRIATETRVVKNFASAKIDALRRAFSLSI